MTGCIQTTLVPTDAVCCGTETVTNHLAHQHIVPTVHCNPPSLSICAGRANQTQSTCREELVRVRAHLHVDLANDLRQSIHWPCVFAEPQETSCSLGNQGNPLKCRLQQTFVVVLNLLVHCMSFLRLICWKAPRDRRPRTTLPHPALEEAVLQETQVPVAMGIIVHVPIIRWQELLNFKASSLHPGLEFQGPPLADPHG